MIISENDIEILSVSMLLGYTGRIIRYVERNNIRDIKDLIRQCALYLIRSGDTNYKEFNKSIRNILIIYKSEIELYEKNEYV